MKRWPLLLLTLASGVAMASSCPDGDQLLQNNTPLADLCPKGFGQFHPQSIGQAIKDQQSNAKMIVAAAQDGGVPVDLALAVSYHESEGFNSCAGSDTGVKGPMQLTQATGRSYGYNRDVNEQNVKGGMAALKSAVDKCGGATDFTCLARYYNGSPRPGEHAGWARGVQRDYGELRSNPVLAASACSDVLACPFGPGGFDPAKPVASGAAAPSGPADLTLPASAG